MSHGQSQSVSVRADILNNLRIEPSAIKDDCRFENLPGFQSQEWDGPCLAEISGSECAFSDSWTSKQEAVEQRPSKAKICIDPRTPVSELFPNELRLDDKGEKPDGSHVLSVVELVECEEICLGPEERSTFESSNS